MMDWQWLDLAYIAVDGEAYTIAMTNVRMPWLPSVDSHASNSTDICLVCNIYTAPNYHIVITILNG